MGFESFHQEKISMPENSKDKKEEINESRRNFLKTLGKAALVGAAVSFGIEGCGSKKKEEKRMLPEKKKDKIPEKIFIDETQEEGYVDDEDIKTVREAIDFKNKGKILIDRSVSDKTRREWERKYKNNPKLSDSLDRGIKGIEPFLPELRRIFKKENVPEELIFLAIPESHWQTKVSSNKGAKGVYQFTEETGRKFGLIINDKVDEREDPIKSAEACAKYLKYLYEKCNKDWELALSGYNGGFIWSYLSDCYSCKKTINYEGFLGFISNGIDNLKRETQNSKFVLHEVRNGENLKKIAAIYKLSEESIRSYNNLRNILKNKSAKKLKIRKNQERSEVLRKGQKLRIPLVDKKGKSLFKSREAAFLYKTAGYLENLVYPPKYVAVLKLIKKNKPEWFESNNLIIKNNAGSNIDRG